MSGVILPPPAGEPRTASIINRIVASSLRQRFLVVLMALALVWAAGRYLGGPRGWRALAGAVVAALVVQGLPVMARLVSLHCPVIAPPWSTTLAVRLNL